MIRIISRGISNLEDMEILAREEVEETVRVEEATRFLIEGPFVVVYKPIDTVGRYHSGLQKTNEWFFFSDFALFSGLLVNLEIPKNVGMPPDI